MHTGAHRVVVGAALAAAGLVLAGCTRTPTAAPASPSATTPTTGARTSDCLAQPPPDPDEANPGTALGPDDPAAFVECGVMHERIPGKGEWRVRFERRVVGGAAELARALRLPDDPLPPEVACAAMAVVPPPALWAVDGNGHARRVHVPVTGCGAARPEVWRAHRALSWVTVHRELLTR